MPSPPAPVSDRVNHNFSFQWAEINRAATLFVLLLASSFILGMIERINSSPWPEAVVSGVNALIVLGFAGLRHKEIVALLGVPRIAWRNAIELTLLSLALLALMSIYFALIEYLGVPMLRAASEFQKARWGLGAMVVLVSLMPAVVEEMAFRGVIQSSLEHVFDWREAWIIQAALFSVLHLLPMMFPSHFVIGLGLGYLRHRSKSLYPGMVLHASWNALVLFQELS